jgi:uncharacterized membrane protein YfcA
VSPLSLIFGAVVGLSLGLTGGGGAIFAVPLLVYGLHVPAKDAVVISLISVGSTSFVGFLHRWQLKEVDVKTGLIFAVAGIIGAPIGTWLATLIPDVALMVMFAALMLIVAVLMWRQSQKKIEPTEHASALEHPVATNVTCQRNATGQLKLTSRCALMLMGLGIFVGIQTGLFGVGGGFLIVPALVLFSGIPILHAVGTSLMVISLVSISGIVSQLYSGRTIPFEVTSLFIVGGIFGLFAGQRIGKSVSPPMLQKIFAVAILFVAIFVLVRNLSS